MSYHVEGTLRLALLRSLWISAVSPEHFGWRGFFWDSAFSGLFVSHFLGFSIATGQCVLYPVIVAWSPQVNNCYRWYPERFFRRLTFFPTLTLFWTECDSLLFLTSSFDWLKASWRRSKGIYESIIAKCSQPSLDEFCFDWKLSKGDTAFNEWRRHYMTCYYNYWSVHHHSKVQSQDSSMSALLVSNYAVEEKFISPLSVSSDSEGVSTTKNKKVNEEKWNVMNLMVIYIITSSVRLSQMASYERTSKTFIFYMRIWQYDSKRSCRIS